MMYFRLAVVKPWCVYASQAEKQAEMINEVAKLIG